VVEAVGQKRGRARAGADGERRGTPAGRSLVLDLRGAIGLAEYGGAEIALPRSRRARAVLAILALSEAGALPRARVAALLWSRLPPRQAGGSLRKSIYELSRALDTGGAGDLLRRDRLSVGIDTSRLMLVRPAAGSIPALVDLDPALDDWLRLRPSASAAAPATAAPAVAAAAQRPESVPAAGTECSPCDGAHGSRMRDIAAEVEVAASEEGEGGAALADAIAGALLRLRWVAVRRTAPAEAPSSSSRWNGPSPDAARSPARGTWGAGARRGDAYRLAVRGHRPGDERVRLLLEAPSGSLVWSDTLRVPPVAGGTPDAEEVAARVAARADTALLLAEAARAAAAPPALRAASSYLSTMAALPGLLRLRRQEFLDAGPRLAEAVRLNPGNALAQALRAYWYVFLVGENWTAEPWRARRAASQAASEAVEADAASARALAVAGHVRAFAERRLTEALALHARALRADPASLLAWRLSGIARAYAGDLADADRNLERAAELAPDDPHAFFGDGGLALVRLLAGEWAAAAERAADALAARPRFSAALRVRVAALALSGRREDAGVELQRLLELEPTFSLDRFRRAAPYARPEHRDLFVRGLALAGLR
jgi:tetratricopeptide (TPR) repeat protein